MPLIYALALPLQALAAEEPARPHSPAVDFIYAVLPFLVMGAILWWFLRRYQRTSSPLMKRSIEYYERSEQHMQKMEQLGERIATALEKVVERSAKDGTTR